MALARLVIADQTSEEVAALRRAVNSLLLMMSNAGASITATCTAEEVLSAWSAAINTGTDDNAGSEGSADYVASNATLEGVALTVHAPRLPARGTITLTLDETK